MKLLTYEEGHDLLDESFEDLPYLFPDNNAYIFVEKDEVIGTAFLVFDEEESSVYIGNIDVAKEGGGYGRKMIHYLKELPNVKVITGESAPCVMGFFEKMGATFGEYDTCMEGYEFAIYC